MCCLNCAALGVNDSIFLGAGFSATAPAGFASTAGTRATNGAPDDFASFVSGAPGGGVAGCAGVRWSVESLASDFASAADGVVSAAPTFGSFAGVTGAPSP